LYFTALKVVLNLSSIVIRYYPQAELNKNKKVKPKGGKVFMLVA